VVDCACVVGVFHRMHRHCSVLQCKSSGPGA
jgi:hypothetical protein